MLAGELLRIIGRASLGGDLGGASIMEHSAQYLKSLADNGDCRALMAGSGR